MKVWIVGVSDCESNHIRCVCATKELAVEKLLEARNELITDWKELLEHVRNANGSYDTMYVKMIESLEGDDYENWDNYPHESPYMYEIEVLGL